jgi:hypothetical protein
VLWEFPFWKLHTPLFFLLLPLTPTKQHQKMYLNELNTHWPLCIQF